MKNWFTIGQFAEKVKVSPKALRLYEKMGLILSHARGENGYRYYDDSQIEMALRLKEFKNLGFSLAEIKALLHADQDIKSEKIISSMKMRLSLIANQVNELTAQKNQITGILTSLENKSEPLEAQQRRAIMSFYGKVSIVVTGCEGLDKTAHFIQQHFQNANQIVPILHWKIGLKLEQEKPYILVIKETDLKFDEIKTINPDIIVIKNLGSHSKETQEAYLKLYSDVGPHVNTVLHADDRASVDLARTELIKKGRIFYFSKNRGFEPQIKNIGGIVSDGEEVEIFGFNLKPDIVKLRLGKIMPFEDEIALLSSFGAVLTIGLKKENLQTA
ncbi:MAG: MerR family transcriptional regulator [Bdellovibrio sp.]